MISHGKHALLPILGALLLAGIFLGISAGELEPPGLPGPTMKPLPELEPRTPIFADQMPFTIAESGSYYLTSNITTSGGGITIDADDVTIDLMGFTLEGGTGNGITSLATILGSRVQNGTVQGWGQHGIAMGERAVVVNVLSQSNFGNGIQLSHYSQVIDSAGDANGGHGIVVGNVSNVTRCRGTANGENGIWADYSMIVNSLANVNGKAGIRVDNGCHVIECTAQFNDQNQATDRAGIWVKGDNNRIERNHMLWNNIGLDVDGDDNIIFGNTVSKSRSVAIDIDTFATGNLIEVKTDLTTAGPWANFVK